MFAMISFHLCEDHARLINEATLFKQIEGILDQGFLAIASEASKLNDEIYHYWAEVIRIFSFTRPDNTKTTR